MEKIKELISVKNVVFVLVLTVAFVVTFQWYDSKMRQAIEDNKEAAVAIVAETVPTESKMKTEETEEAYDEQLFEELQEAAVEEEGNIIHFVRTIDYKTGYEQSISEMEVAINKYNNNAPNYESKVQIDVNRLDNCVQIEVTSNWLKDRNFPVTELGQTALVLPSTVIWKECDSNEFSNCIAQGKEKDKLGRTVEVIGVAYLSEDYVEIHMLDDKYATKELDREREYKLLIKYGEIQGWVSPDRLTRNGIFD